MGQEFRETSAKGKTNTPAHSWFRKAMRRDNRVESAIETELSRNRLFLNTPTKGRFLPPKEGLFAVEWTRLDSQAALNQHITKLRKTAKTASTSSCDSATYSFVKPTQEQDD
jgi:hypothetical protein